MAKKSWPYPVLDPEGEDYPNCAFQGAVEMRQTRKEFIGKVRMDLGSETLQSAVADGNATFAVQIHCPRTSFRKIEKSKQEQFQFKLPEGVLRDEFTVQPFLLSERKWQLSSSEFASTFKGLTFSVEKGYVLAIAPQVIFDAEKQLDDLKSVKAIFHVLRCPDPERRVVDFDFETDRIGIVLSQADYDLFSIFRVRAPYSQLFVCSLVLPALHQALLLLKESSTTDVGGPRWKRVLSRCLRDMGEESFDRDRAFEVAQKILEMPIGRALGAVNAKESEG